MCNSSISSYYPFLHIILVQFIIFFFSSYKICTVASAATAKSWINSVPKQQRRHLPSLLYDSFFYDKYRIVENYFKWHAENANNGRVLSGTSSCSSLAVPADQQQSRAAGSLLPGHVAPVSWASSRCTGPAHGRLPDIRPAEWKTGLRPCQEQKK